MDLDKQIVEADGHEFYFAFLEEKDYIICIYAEEKSEIREIDVNYNVKTR